MKNGQHTKKNEVDVHDIEYYKQLVQQLEEENEQMKASLWVDSNLTKFDDILRSNYDKPLTEFADAVIFHLSKLTQALRGTFFSINQDLQLIEAVAGYACTVDTLAKPEFRIGEGLIGQSIKGKETIVLDNIPQHNMVLEASMGQLSGNCIVVIPLVFNQDVYGAVELLYLHNIEQTFLDLLERLGKNIASMLNSIQNNVKTRRLLEESKALEKELRTQEEELRQNMEELTATQEKMYRKEKELSSNVNAINQTISTIEFDMKGNILHANQLFMQLMNYQPEELIGKHHRMFLEAEYAQSVEYKEFWNELRKGKAQNAQFKRIGNQGKDVWLRASYIPVKGLDGTPYKVMKFALDISEEKRLRQDVSNQLTAIDRSSAVIEFDMSGHILEANERFLRTLGYTLHDIKGKHHRMFVGAEQAASEEYRQFWQKLQNGEYIEGEFQRFTQNGEEIWIKGNYNPILDFNGMPYKVVKFAFDITQQKKLSQDFNNQLQAINKSNAVIEFDLDGNILKTNQLFLDLTKYAEDEIIGKHHQIFVEAHYAQSEEYNHFWHQLRNGQFVEGEFRRTTKDGQKVWIKGSYNPILGLDNKPYKIVNFALDITMQKELEVQNASRLEEVKTAEEELRQNMEELVATQEKMKAKEADLSGNLLAIDHTICSIEFDTEGKILKANQLFLDLMGYTLEEVKGKHHRMFADKMYAQSEEYAAFWEDLRKGESNSSEFKRYGNNGKEVWLRATYTPIKDGYGVPYKVIKMAFDVTEEKKLCLDVSSRLEAIDRSTAVIEFDLDGYILEANTKFLKIVGYDAAEILGKHHQILVDAQYAQSTDYQQFWHQLKNGRYIEGEFERLNKEGQKIWIKGSYNPIFDGDGKPYKIVKFALDMRSIARLENSKVTEEQPLKQVNELASSQQKMQRQVETTENRQEEINTLLHTTVDVVITVNTEGLICSANSSIAQLLGYEPEEIVGQSIATLIPDQNTASQEGYIQRYLATGMGTGHRVEVRHKEGHVFDVHMTFSEFKVDDQVMFNGFIRKLDE